MKSDKEEEESKSLHLKQEKISAKISSSSSTPVTEVAPLKSNKSSSRAAGGRAGGFPLARHSSSPPSPFLIDVEVSKHKQTTSVAVEAVKLDSVKAFPASSSNKGESGRTVQSEERATGAVPWSVYKNYISNGGIGATIAMFLSFCLSQGLKMIGDWYRLLLSFHD